ncbi:MAG TPA: AMP-binding protein, partial [Actinomycetota bacterium]
MTRDIVWRPGPSYLEGSNLKRFMDRHGIATYDEVVRRSTADVAWFWEAVQRDLGIEWSDPYDTVLDTSRGIAFPAWFLGGRVNITRNCVDRHAAGPPAGKTALVWEGEDGAVRSVTYRELAAEVSRLAGGLRSLGIGKGDRVGVYMPMSIEAVVAMFAVAKLGAVYLPIFSGFGPAAVAARLRDAEAVALVSADGFWRRGKVVEMKELCDEAADAARVRRCVIHRRIGREVVWHESRDVWWDELVEGQPEDLPCEDTDAEDVWMIAYTSGTTGRPKGAVHVHGGFLVKIASEVAYQTDLRSDDVLYWITDMGWIMGQFEAVGGLALGGTVLLYEGAPDHPGPDRVWDL